jgi:NADPH-dependent 2,4-dienoyl-CoA reductase/sulfur reductase-like enzyme
VYFEENALERLGVDVRLNTRAGPELIKSLQPQAVVVATGALPRLPDDVPGIDQPQVVQGWDVLLGKAATGKRVAVVSQEDYYQTPCVAEYLAAQGKQVEVFHKSVHLATEVARYSIGMVLKRMESCGVKVHPNRVLKAVSGDTLEFVSSWGGQSYCEQGFDSVVLVYGAVQQPELYYRLQEDGSIPKILLAGSAWVPRRLAEATRHGANVGMMV